MFPLKRFGNVPVLITNRHVVDGFHEIKIVLSTTANVDLADILLRQIVDDNVYDGSTIYLEDVSLEDFVTEETEHRMRIVEDV